MHFRQAEELGQMRHLFVWAHVGGKALKREDSLLLIFSIPFQGKSPEDSTVFGAGNRDYIQ